MGDAPGDDSVMMMMEVLLVFLSDLLVVSTKPVRAEPC